MLSQVQNIWWPYTHRDIVANAIECKACREIGKILKSVIPYSKWSTLHNCIKPNDEIQIDFGGSITNEKGIEQHFLASISRFSKYNTVEIVNNASSTNVFKFLNIYKYNHRVPGNN